MKPALRNILAVVAGAVADGVVVGLTEVFNHRLFPYPPGIDLADPAQRDAAMHTAPAGAFGLVLAGIVMGALAAGLVAGWVGRRLGANPRHVATVTGGMLAGVNALNAFRLWHPWWFRVGAVGLSGVVSWWAARRSGGATVS